MKRENMKLADEVHLFLQREREPVLVELFTRIEAALRASAEPEEGMGDPLVEINDLRQFQYDPTLGSPLRRLSANAADEIERLTLLLRAALSSSVENK